MEKVERSIWENISTQIILKLFAFNRKPPFKFGAIFTITIKGNHHKSLIMKNSRILLAFLCGITTGAIAVALYTPYKGSVTRKKLSKKKSNVVAGISENLEKIGNNIKRTLGQETEKTGRAVRKGKRKLS